MTFKKELPEIADTSTRQKLVCMKSATLSLRKQCELLTVHQSNLNCQREEEKPGIVNMMNLMDRHLLDYPAEGMKSMAL